MSRFNIVIIFFLRFDPIQLLIDLLNFFLDVTARLTSLSLSPPIQILDLTPLIVSLYLLTWVLGLIHPALASYFPIGLEEIEEGLQRARVIFEVMIIQGFLFFTAEITHVFNFN